MDPTGANVRRLREARGLSQNALAKQAGITQGHLRDIETGRIRNPGVAVVRALAKALEVDPGALLREAQAPEER
jgi:transcriptional regulator with XRE-family HTH domain